MAFDPNCNQCLDITQFNIPSDNFPTPRLFEDNRKSLIRRYAGSVIAQ
ncbi:hypothetical protein A2U01_0047288, partial [Trifolium medium]|nr:hypothetical protein [Trifolium medium]